MQTPTRIAVTGASGLVGSALVRSLEADGKRVVRLVRRPTTAPDEARWDPDGADAAMNRAALAGCDAVVHLAGAPIGGRRWTEAYKAEIRDSRVIGTAAIAQAVAEQDPLPRVFLSASGIDYYGDTGDRTVDEDAPAGAGFMPKLCQDWEAATGPARTAGVRTVLLRTGIVIAREGPAFARMLPFFRAGIGGPLGSGKQYWPTISLEDVVAAQRFLMAEGPGALDGPVNLTAPEPVTNREVARTLGRVMHRPSFLRAPGFAVRLVVGEVAVAGLGSHRVVPRRLLDAGFAFDHPEVEDCIRLALR